MELQTKHWGLWEVPAEKIITFPRGLYGFDEAKRFILIENEDPHNPLCWLQAVDDPELAFVILNPFSFCRDYEFTLSAEDQADLDLTDPQDVLVFALVVVPQDLRQMTANLLAPLVINSRLRRGKQIVLYQQEYSTQHLICQKQGQNKLGKGEGGESSC